MSETFRQLALDLPTSPRFGREDFLVSDSNRAAFEMFERWPDWPDPMLLLLGPTGAGKSHLAHIWAAQARARIIPASELAAVDIAELASGAVVLEDADRAAGIERPLFHLINLVRDNGCFMTITARSWPDHWGLDVADLLSRLRRSPAVEIGEPDDSLVRAVLVKLFHDRQLTVDSSVVDFLALRIERSLASARSVVEALDREGLERGRPITRPMAADFIRRLDSI